ncbi:GNAT family N-acetyltransferase [Nocardiopsis composta]|uniref:GNAT superfamily N-acetyltransferase n=1 Tax=Nocardiopsis composta TaxID=157465 RepID=A0A7W8QL32_9ACTN|nr:GNAT family N-acetyltransferase [Nocardiopsis composta]MBB5432229.1 GNAT superfamily N-acetyltransferase [Nocardiopsis composta]
MTTETRLTVRKALPTDAAAIAALAERDDPAAAETGETLRSRVAALVGDPSAITLVATEQEVVRGYLVGGTARSTVRPGEGQVARIEEFAVDDPHDWWPVGSALIEEARSRLRAAGAVRLIVTTSARDPAKQAFLWRCGLTLVTEAYQEELR